VRIAENAAIWTPDNPFAIAATLNDVAEYRMATVHTHVNAIGHSLPYVVLLDSHGRPSRPSIFGSRLKRMVLPLPLTWLQPALAKSSHMTSLPRETASPAPLSPAWLPHIAVRPSHLPVFVLLLIRVAFWLGHEPTIFSLRWNSHAGSLEGWLHSLVRRCTRADSSAMMNGE
jgi:hypothetical protein